MNMKLTVKYNDLPIYDIILENDFSLLNKELRKLNTGDKKLCIVSDTNVSKFYLEDLTSKLKECCKTVETFIFPAGEASKNLDTVYALYEHLIKAKFDRKDILVALGGGVVGDLTGYAAATYLRGIQFIQIPTSLLSMVDSSIGGKTGVDFQAYKNMVGAFHQPKLVYMNLSTLKTLNDRQFYSGMGEIIKHGIIKDSSYFQWLKKNNSSIIDRDPIVLQEMIYRSCKIKREVVEKDPTELGDRALLNFGHTVGHAIEKLKNFELLHGECVALGMVAASYLSYQKGSISKEQLEDIITVIRNFKLPVSVSGLNAKEILNVMANDKKMESGRLKFIVLSEDGHAIIDSTITQDEMLNCIGFLLS